MRKERVLLILGIWVAILPQLGFPYSWKNVLFTLSGLILVYYSYIIYKETKITEKVPPIQNDDKIVSENSNFNQ